MIGFNNGQHPFSHIFINPVARILHGENLSSQHNKEIIHYARRGLALTVFEKTQIEDRNWQKRV